jgi:hypothetical protein
MPEREAIPTTVLCFTSVVDTFGSTSFRTVHWRRSGDDLSSTRLRATRHPWRYPSVESVSAIAPCLRPLRAAVDCSAVIRDRLIEYSNTMSEILQALCIPL